MNSKICHSIRDRILLLKYAPGQIINEKVLADEFGVSRTPLREVLFRLEWEKLVSIMPRAGAMVTQVEFQKLRDVFQIRVDIEGLVGRLAAERISDDQLEEMREIQEECKDLYANKKPGELVNIDMKFREVLNHATNNAILKEISDYLYNLTLRVWYLIFDKVNWSAEVEQEIDEIEKTIEILSLRDPPKAESYRRSVIIDHVERIKNKF